MNTSAKTSWTGCCGGSPIWVGTDSARVAAFQSSSNPDEYGFRFTVPFKATLYGIEFPLAQRANVAGAAGEARVCSGAAASPSLLTSVTVDGYEKGANSEDRAKLWVKLTSPQTLTPGTIYYVSFRATSTASYDWIYATFPTNPQLVTQPFGTSGYQVTRDGDTVGTGAFSENTTTLPFITLLISQIDDGAGGGGVAPRPMVIQASGSF